MVKLYKVCAKLTIFPMVPKFPNRPRGWWSVVPRSFFSWAGPMKEVSMLSIRSTKYIMVSELLIICLFSGAWMSFWNIKKKYCKTKTKILWWHVRGNWCKCKHYLLIFQLYWSIEMEQKLIFELLMICLFSRAWMSFWNIQKHCC